jgi:hypothetical protein
MVISDSEAAQLDVSGYDMNAKRPACGLLLPGSEANHVNHSIINSASDVRSNAANAYYLSQACDETADHQSNNHRTAAASGYQLQCDKLQTAMISRTETGKEMKTCVDQPKIDKTEGCLQQHCDPDIIDESTNDNTSSSSSNNNTPCCSSCLPSTTWPRGTEQASSTASMSLITASQVPLMSCTARLPVSLSGWSATVMLSPMPPLPSIGAYATSTARQQAAAANDFMMKLQWLFDEVTLAMSPELTSAAHYRPPAIVITANVASQCDWGDIKRSTHSTTACGATSLVDDTASRACCEPSDAVSELASTSTSGQPVTGQPQCYVDYDEMTSVSAFISEADQRINEMESLPAVISDTQRASLSAIIREADRRIRELLSTAKDVTAHCTNDKVLHTNFIGLLLACGVQISFRPCRFYVSINQSLLSFDFIKNYTIRNCQYPYYHLNSIFDVA